MSRKTDTCTMVLVPAGLIDGAEKLIQALAEDLREYADAAAESGENIQATEDLLKDVDRYFNPDAKAK